MINMLIQIGRGESPPDRLPFVSGSESISRDVLYACSWGLDCYEDN